MDSSEKILEFITIARGMFRQDDLVLPVTPKTVTKLRLLLVSKFAKNFDYELSGRETRSLRVAILRAITGFPLTTQNQMSQHFHSVLIQLLEGEKYDDVIRDIASACKEFTKNRDLRGAEDLYRFDRELSDLPDMPEPDGEYEY